VWDDEEWVEPRQPTIEELEANLVRPPKESSEVSEGEVDLHNAAGNNLNNFETGTSAVFAPVI
jgi:hypothetical protein